MELKVSLDLGYGKINVLKFQTRYSILLRLKFCCFVHLSLKMLSGMANSEYPDQTLGAF